MKQPFSKKLIKKIVQDILVSEKEELNVIPGLDVLQNSAARPVTRIVWFVIIASCLCTCVYQVGSRIEYYLSEPTVVDVLFEELSDGKLPILVLTSRDTEAFTQYLKKNPLPIARSCYPNFKQVLGLNNFNLTTDEFWRLMNTTTVIKDAYLAKNGHRVENLSLSDYNGVGGVCTEIFFDKKVEYRDSSVKMHVSLNYPRIEKDPCPTPLIIATIQSSEEKTYDLSSMVLFAVRRKTMIAISVNKYTFLNTTKRTCVDRKIYEDCEKDCLRSIFHDKSTRCRFPFIDEENNLPSCKPSKKTLQAYNDVTNRLSEFNPRVKCSCPIPCSKTQQTNMLYNDVTGSEQIELYFASNVARAMTERYAYEILPLLCDIGGNLGLYLGLSLLSTVQLFSHYARLLIRRKTTWKNNSDLKRHVYDVCRAEVKKHQTKTKENLQLRNLQLRKFQSYFNSIITAIAVLLCVYQTYDRIAYFFNYPTFVAIEVVEDTEINLPSIVTCFITTEIFIKKKPLGENVSYSCSNTDFLHLLDSPYIYAHNANKLWQESATIASHLKIVPNWLYGDLKPFPTAFGNCTEASVDRSLRYSPMKSSISSILPRNTHCACSYKIFINTNRKKLSLKNYIDLPCIGHSTTKFMRQTLIKLNIPQNPCMTPDEANLCEENCYKNKMITNINCKLPFMTDVSLPVCNTSKSANDARSVYFKAYMNTDSVKECSCRQSCNETIFLPYTTYDDAALNSPICIGGYGLQSNLREIISQNLAFTWIKLLCDIGSNLGVVLGMSMLSLIHLTQRTIYSSTRVIKNYVDRHQVN